MDFNPLLTEIQGHLQAMSPAAQAVVTKVAGSSMPSSVATPQTAAVPGTLLPRPDSASPGNISLPAATPSLSTMSALPSPKPQLVTGPKRGQAMMTTGEHIPMGTIQGDTVERSRLIDQGAPVDSIYHNITNSSFGQDHPLAGKLLGGVAQVAGKIGDTLANGAPGIAREIPGTTIRHNMLVGQANTALTQDEANAEKQAQTAGLQQKGDLEEQQARAAELTPTTEEESAALGVPVGTMLNAASRAALAKQSGINQTKQTIGEQANATKLSVADLQQAARDAAAANKPQPHIITMQAGQPHVMERDPSTKAYTIDRGIAPPNYAQVLPEMLTTKTTELLGPDNVQHRYQFNPETHAFDIDMGAAPTGQAAHQIFQGAAIEQLGPQIIKDINDHREILGNLSSYYNQWLSGTPVSDPDAAKLMTELMSFAATQPALHAFRSTNAMEAFEKMVGGLAKDPDSTIASINGLMLLPKTFTSLAQQPANRSNHPAQGGAPKTGDVVDGYKFKGGDPAKQSSWEQVKK